MTGNGGGDARRGDVGGRGEWGGGEGSGGGGWGEGGSEMRDQKWGGVGYDSASRAKVRRTFTIALSPVSPPLCTLHVAYINCIIMLHAMCTKEGTRL